MNIGNKSIVVTVGYKCNSNCKMCVVGSKDKQNNNATTQEVKDILSEGRKNKVDRVEFSGGEPTIRKDIIQLVTFAKAIGYKKIGVSTNGIALSNNIFCKKLIKAGVNIFTISLHASNETINKKITNNPNSFQKTVDGITNVLKQKDIKICLVTVIQKYNYKQLVEIGNLISKLGVKQWNISNLIPIGMKKKDYLSLCINHIELKKILVTLIPLSKILQISLYYFAQSTIPNGFQANDIITMSKKGESTNYISYDKEGSFKSI